LNYQNNYIKTLKPVARISKFFAALSIIFKVSTKLFWWFNKIIFRSVSRKILHLPQQNHSFAWNAQRVDYA